MTAKAKANKGGRPVEYRPAFANELIELMGSGLSLTASMASLGFTRETANDWSRKYPEFSDAIALGKGKRSLFLEKRGIAAESGPAVTFVMKALANCNREDFTDKVEHEISGGLQIQAIKRIIVDPAHSDT